MSTEPAHARALQICQEEGAPAESAERIICRLRDAGWHWTPPATFQPEPQTGPRSEDPNPHVEKLRQILRNATKPTEYEETP